MLTLVPMDSLHVRYVCGRGSMFASEPFSLGAQPQQPQAEWVTLKDPLWENEDTPRRINMEPNGPLEDDFPLQPSHFQVPCEFSRVYMKNLQSHS